MPGPVPEAELARIQALIEAGSYQGALTAARALAVNAPAHRDVLYSIAVSQRFLRQEQAALETLAQLRVLAPDFSRLYQEIGYCRAGLRDGPAAIEAFLKAVTRNPALSGSWTMLQRLYSMIGDQAAASAAAGHVAVLARLPPEVVTATSLFSDGDLAAAEAMVRAYLLKHGNHVEAMRLLARIGLAQDVLDDAEYLLRAVLDLEPGYRAARFDYASVLLRRHRHQAAIDELEQLCQAEPGNRTFRTNLATAYAGLGKHEQALATYRETERTGPPSADLQLSVGHCLKTLGDTPAAIQAYREAARIRPDFGDAYWSLANLKTYRFSDEELARMRAALAAPETSATDRCHLSFALGKALEDREDWAGSFESYLQGNQIRKASSRFRLEVLELTIAQQIKVCTPDLFRRHAGAGCPDTTPIFIVGLPRSGSTLIEQILAAHTMIEGTMELADIPRMVQSLQGRGTNEDAGRYPAVLESLTDSEFARLGEQYIADTRPYRVSDRPRFTDKMPNNFRHIGLIRLILPNARIIDARREPMACCFSNFKQYFAQGQEFSYGLEDIARYYRLYMQLMQHWDAVLPGHVLRVQHEDLVADLEHQVRRMLGFLGLEFEPQCLEFHRSTRSVRTASSEQVRRPLSTEGLDQWRHFEPWLGPLREALGPELA